jgi:hypothetical protein
MDFRSGDPEAEYADEPYYPADLRLAIREFDVLFNDPVQDPVPTLREWEGQSLSPRFCIYFCSGRSSTKRGTLFD